MSVGIQRDGGLPQLLDAAPCRCAWLSRRRGDVDVDFAAGVIHVRHQLARGRRGVPPRRVPPKTRASARKIPLVPQLAAMLSEHKRRSTYTHGSDYVFATRSGTPLLHRNVARRAFSCAVNDSGLGAAGRSRVRFHDLRHTFPSHLIIDIRLDVARSDASSATRAPASRSTPTHISSSRPPIAPTSGHSSLAATSPCCSRESSNRPHIHPERRPAAVCATRANAVSDIPRLHNE